MKILIVDDLATNRKLIRFYIEQLGHVACEAKDGLEACEIFASEGDIDMVLMDLLMPVLNGYEATRRIKDQQGGRYTPVIFVTSSNDDESLSKCLNCGGDDFIGKPINKLVLDAKIKAHQRILDLNKELQTLNSELKYHHSLIEKEHEIVEKIFETTMANNALFIPHVKYYISPQSKFNGDVFLISQHKSGGFYVLLGDFTGHGLGASQGSLPLADIFFSMTERACSIEQLVTAINTRLSRMLPEFMFLCATVILLDRSGSRADIWMGGMNDLLILSDDNSVTKIKSSQLPLGILKPDKFNSSTETISVNKGNKIYCYTDGLVEACNELEEPFGNDRVVDILINGEEESCNNKIAIIKHEVEEFQGGKVQDDDIALIEITCAPYEYSEINLNTKY